VALELVSREPERVIQGDLDTRLFANLAARGSFGRLVSLEVALRERPFVSAPDEEAPPLIDYHRTAEWWNTYRDRDETIEPHGSASVMKKASGHSPEAITRRNGKLRELHRASNYPTC